MGVEGRILDGMMGWNDGGGRARGHVVLDSQTDTLAVAGVVVVIVADSDQAMERKSRDSEFTQCYNTNHTGQAATIMIIDNTSTPSAMFPFNAHTQNPIAIEDLGPNVRPFRSIITNIVQTTLNT